MESNSVLKRCFPACNCPKCDLLDSMKRLQELTAAGSDGVVARVAATELLHAVDELIAGGSKELFSHRSAIASACELSDHMEGKCRCVRCTLGEAVEKLAVMTAKDAKMFAKAVVGLIDGLIAEGSEDGEWLRRLRPAVRLLGRGKNLEGLEAARRLLGEKPPGHREGLP